VENIRVFCRIGSAEFFARKRHQGQMPGSLDRLGQLALVFGAGAGLSPGADFAVIGGKPPQGVDVFVINN
jgi:hypothetical protein